MNTQTYMKDIIKIAKSDPTEICKDRNFKIYDLTVKDKFSSKRNVEVLLYDGINYHNSIEDLNLKNCKLVVKLDGVVKFESDNGAFKQSKVSYKSFGKFDWKRFFKLESQIPAQVTMKRIEFRSKYHRNQYETFRRLIACQMRLDNAMHNFVNLNSYRIDTI